MMLTKVLLALVASSSALQVGPAKPRQQMTRRATFVAGLAPLALALPAFADNARVSPAAGNHGGWDSGDVKISREEIQKRVGASFSDGNNNPGARGKKVGVAGTYTDPSHGGAKRTIMVEGGRTYRIDGADEDGKPWSISGIKSGTVRGRTSNSRAPTLS